MAASSIAKLGTPMSCEASPANPMPVPSPSSAVTIGRPIASSEPKVMNRMIMAASRPTAVAVPSDGFCACSIASPPSCTSSWFERARSAVEMTFSIDALGRTLARLSKLTVANAICPSVDTACAPAGE